MGSKPLVDHEGRPFDFSTVVVNFANVGTTYGINVLRRNKSVKAFDYDGIRKCVVHLKNKQRLNVIGVIYENFSGIDKGREVHEPPADIQQMCSSIELTPRIMGMQHKSADDEMTIKCATEGIADSSTMIIIVTGASSCVTRAYGSGCRSGRNSCN